MQINYEIERNAHTFQQVNEPHFHSGYEVLICLSDGGKFQILDNVYPLRRGMMFVMPVSILHRCIVDNVSYERYILRFSKDVLRFLSSPQTDLESVFDCSRYYTLLSDDDLSSLTGLIELCITDDAEFGGNLQRNIYFMQIMLTLSRILRCNLKDEKPLSSKTFEKILPIINYIHENYTEEISLESISNHFFVSKYYLCRQFKSATGLGTNAYIVNYRVRQACALLRNGSSVQSAGEQVGFGNNAHFIRTFGQIIGVSPGKYVRSLQYSTAGGNKGQNEQTIMQNLDRIAL